MRTINMLSSADTVKGHGVLSAYLEQVDLVKCGLKDTYEVSINKVKFSDITHYHTIDFAFFINNFFEKLRGTTVAYVHFVPETIDDSLKLPYIVKVILYKYIIWFYKSVDHLVVVNPYFIDILKSYNIDEDKITYIPNFVSEENFYRNSEQEIADEKKKIGIPQDKFVVLGVGQVQTRKGILDFIEVAKRLPDVQFVWAGGFSFGSMTDGYKELKKVVNCPPENVKFLGIIDREKMNDLYNIADLMFLPSFKELFPMSVLEAMAIKIPVLLRDVDIYENILFDYYLKGNNVEEFAEVISGIQNKGANYKTACDNSWRCHQFYSKDSVLKQWKKFYDMIYYQRNELKFRSRLNEK